MSSENETYNLNDVCNLLSISSATAKNWIKLGKLNPLHLQSGKPLFSKPYIEKILNDIQSGTSNKLKSRRNKKHVIGSFFYKDYVSENSENLKNVIGTLDYILENNITLSNSEINSILFDCAKKLFLSKNMDLSKFSSLLNDLSTSISNNINFKEKHNKIFSLNYIWHDNEDILGLLYLSLSTLSSRKARGAYFTPTKIVEKVMKNLDFSNSARVKILDPCCGSGNFLLQLPTSINLEQIYGKDIDSTSIKLARINMALKYNPKEISTLYTNFSCENFLFQQDKNSYEYIIGNPPWGYDFKKIELEKLRSTYGCASSKTVDSCDVFVEQSLNRLSKNGELFFVLPEAILNVKTHNKIRKILSQISNPLYIEYLGNIFDKVQCPSILIKIKKTETPMVLKGLKIKTKENSFVINSDRKISDKMFNFKINDTEYKILNKIFSVKNKVYLKGNGIFALGIVTGDNSALIKHRKSVGNEPILKGSDISKYKINQAQNYIHFNPDKFQQVAPTEYYRADEKLLYKFISDKLIFAYDSNKTLSLNSCNILIPTFKDLDIKYVLAILNSSVAQFVFNKQFSSIKVLRSHIESIPIPECSKLDQQKIIKYVDKILICESDSEFQALYKKLDLIISNLYNLSEEEFSKISIV